MLRPYQLEAAAWLSKQFRGIVVAPAGSGKTILVAGALDMTVRSKARINKVKIGWMANTKEQCQQAKAAISNFPMVERQDVKIACSAANTDWSDRDVLVVDEVHHAGSALGWQAQIENCPKARWGMTATPPEDQFGIAGLKTLFGPVFVITRDKVQQNLAPAVVRWLDDSDPDLKATIDAEIARVVKIRSRYWHGDQGQLWGQVAWQTCVELGIVNNKARNAAAVAAATNPRQTIMLVNQVEHAHALAANIPNAIPCNAAMGAKARRVALEDFASGKVRCLVATKMLEEGADLPNAEVLVMVSGGRSSRIAEQSTGRVLRQFAGKTHGRIFDFRDTYHPLAAKHSRAREDVYRKLGYEIHP